MIRLFIALPLPNEVEHELGRLIGLFRPKTGAVRWVPAGNIHLTVKFLGDTEEKLVDQIGLAIDEVAAEYQPFAATIDRLGAFPNLRRPNVIWVGASAPVEPAAEIARKIEHRMHELRFPKEKRPFKAHLTLGRVKQGQSIGELAEYLAAYRLIPIACPLDRLTLFKSTLTPGGAIYDRLHEAMLSRPNPA